MNLHETVSERLGEYLAAPVRGAGRVLRGEEHEVRMRGDRLLKLGDEELAVIVEKTVQRLENVRGGEVELVQDDPVPAANRLHERALLERELPCLRIGENEEQRRRRQSETRV